MERALYKQYFSERIVFRLRLAFGLIVALLGLSVLVGTAMLYQLKSSQQKAIAYSVPRLADSQQLVSFLTKITDLSARLSSENSGNQVIQLSTSLIQHRNELLLVLEREQSTTGLEAEISRQLHEHLNQLELSLREIIPLKLEITRVEDQVGTQLSGVALIRIAFNEVIAPLASEIGTKVDDALNGQDSIPAVPTLTLKQLFHQQHHLQKLTYQMSALLEVTEQLSISNTKAQHESLVARQASSFNTIPQYLNSIGDVQIRNKVADMLDQLRVLTLGGTGLSNNISVHRNYRSKFEKIHAKQTRLVEDISDITDSIVVSAAKDISDTTEKFGRNLNVIASTSVLIGIVILALIVFVIFQVVEKQINRRMSRLTSAVMDIAAGNTERDVGVSGSDEIGVMADALEIFKQNARELYRSNKELEQFAYAASHDLKSPLTAIQNLAQWTIEDSEDQLSEESRSNLHELLKRSNRLSVLQSDLLEYAQAGGADESVDVLNLNELVDELSDHLDQEGKYRIQVSDAPLDCYTWITPLRQIILNLVNNAIKHNDRDTGHIEISAYANESRLFVSVTDDGPGIPVEYHEKIFNLFEKLESKDAVEGSGLGLSMVKKMIERSNGSISINSNPLVSRGCTFAFDWPLATEFMQEKKVVGF